MTDPKQSTVRRVRLDDKEPGGYSEITEQDDLRPVAGPGAEWEEQVAAELRELRGESDGEIARLGMSEAEELLQASIEEAEDETGEPPRTRDLPKVAREPLPTPEEALAAVNGPDDRPQAPSDDTPRGLHPDENDLAVFAETDEVAGMQVVGAHEDFSAEPATRWLRENDLRRTLDGTTRKLGDELQARGRTLENCRRQAFLPGRVKEGRKAMRSDLRQIVVRMIDDGYGPKLIAEALGTTRKALDNLRSG